VAASDKLTRAAPIGASIQILHIDTRSLAGNDLLDIIADFDPDSVDASVKVHLSNNRIRLSNVLARWILRSSLSDAQR
jgi:hypothetical protein